MLSSYRRRFPSSERSIVLFLCNTIWLGALHSLFRFSYISYIAYFFIGSTYHISKLLVPTSREKLFQQHCLFLFFHSEIIPFSSQMYRVCCNNRFPIIHVAIIWHLFACFLIKFHGPFKRIVCFVYLYLSKFSIYYCDINIIVRCHF